MLIFHQRRLMKKVLILTSSGGGGTLTASSAIEDYLKIDYETKSVHVFKDLLSSLDFCKKITFNRHSCEDIYNICIPKKWFRVLTALYYIGKWYIQMRRKKIHAILRNHVIQNKPDLIISVVPILNNIILSIAQELTIPFFLIPTDLDTQMYVFNIIQPTYKHFHIGLPFHDEQLLLPIKKASIPLRYISVIGAPLRHSFFTPKNNDLLKKEFLIPENKPIIMLLMGAKGSTGIEKCIDQLSKIKHSLHIIICTGKNGKHFSFDTIPEHISTSVIQFTDRIADLMALSDIIITKSGSLSVCEAIYMNTPLILDGTTILPWEKLNHQFVKTHKFGTSITRYSDITPLINSFLENPSLFISYKNNLRNLKKENIEIQLRECVQKMIL
jgi:processive 1,2-diacylglycerol beta-glucosyltransferase